MDLRGWCPIAERPCRMDCVMRAGEGCAMAEVTGALAEWARAASSRESGVEVAQQTPQTDMHTRDLWRIDLALDVCESNGVKATFGNLHDVIESMFDEAPSPSRIESLTDGDRDGGTFRHVADGDGMWVVERRGGAE